MLFCSNYAKNYATTIRQGLLSGCVGATFITAVAFVSYHDSLSFQTTVLISKK